MQVAYSQDAHILWSFDQETPTFSNASYSSQYAYLPVYTFYQNGQANQLQSLRELGTRKVDASLFSDEMLAEIQEDWQLKVNHATYKGEPRTVVEVLPFRRSGQQVELLETFDFTLDAISTTRQRTQARANQTYATNSKLAQGEWYKIGVSASGIYQIDMSFLEKLGVKSDDRQAGKVRVYGHRGGMLPELAGAEREDDIQEIPVYVEGSGKDAVAYVFLEGPDKWSYNISKNLFEYQKNLYTEQKNYFITIGDGGKKVQKQTTISQSAQKTITSYNDLRHAEEDVVNLLSSGRLWLGPEMSIAGQQFLFDFPHIKSGVPATISVGLAAKSTSFSSFQISSNNQTLRNVSVSPVSGGTISNAANYVSAQINLANPSQNIPIRIQYNTSDYNSKAWVDFVTVQLESNLVYSGQPLQFRSTQSIGTGSVSQFRLTNTTGQTQVWDVTDIFRVEEMIVSNGTFKAHTHQLKEFIAFDSPAQSPQIIGKVENQNLHALPQADYLIITREKLLPYAREIGEFHYQQEGLTYHVVDAEHIFNEFSSGNNDLSAIRNFVKMFYDRAASDPNSAPKYLLLFGNGNYDNRDLGEFLLPSYQSSQSFEDVVTYVTDDYFGLLDDDEGDDVISTSTHFLDIAIGRITVDDLEKARNAVEKIKRYYAQESFGDWRNQTVFIADDEDNNIHIRDSDLIANHIQNSFLNHNVSKIYLDAFKQQSVSGGHRYPDVTEAIQNNIHKGLFYLNFIGHGGPNGLTHEKVIPFDEIAQWNNENKLFLFCTATCEFTRFDVPTRYSAGERVLMKRDGGAIALVSTTRLVFSDKNKTINEHFVQDLFENSESGDVSIGDVFLKTKNRTNTRENNRKFALFGDPALRLSFPKNRVATQEVLSYSEPTDTIRSLDKITIKGHVLKQGQVAQDFDGVVHVTVYDKMSTRKTLMNDSGSQEFEFKARDQVVYRGKTSAERGEFSLTFIVPKDIDYEFGQAKLSYYAENGSWDANGHDISKEIGGVADSILKDDEGPLVDIYIDDEDFVFGGIASKNSILYVKLEDESGINTSGSGLGHDITAILNEDSKNPIILNTFYEAELGDYTRGRVSYPMSGLENGRHSISVKAWDVLNNSGEDYTEFVVEDKAEMALYYVLNYPNPFTTNTLFSFEHNRPGDVLDVRIEIYTVDGKLVKTLQTMHSSSSRRFTELQWDGLDDYGDKIGKGVYIYKVKVSDSRGDKAIKYQKLVLLR